MNLRGVSMRHWAKFLILITIFYLSGTSISATSLSTSISGSSSVETGSEITLTFFLDIEEPVKQLDAKLNIDLDLLEIVGSPVALNGLSVLINENNEITVSSANGVSGSVSFMRMTFKATETFSLDSQTSVSLSGVSGILFDSEESVSGSGSTKLITAISPKSDNNYLSSLFTNAGSIGFKRNTFEYSLVVEHDISRIRIVAKAEDEKATVKEDAMYDLSVYRNMLNIVVMAENGARRTYTINVIRKDAFGHTSRKSSNSELKSLAIEGYEIEFSPLINEYRLTVGNIVDNVLVYAEAADPKSSVIIDNLSLLKLGENRVQVTVIAENGQSRIYTIFVTRSLEAPTVKLQDLGDIVYLTTATTIPVIIEDYYLLSGEVLDKVRRAAKILDIQKLNDQGQLLYRWTIDGRSITTDTSIDFSVRLDSIHSYEIGELLNSSNFRTISFSHQREFPVGTIVSVYIGNMFPHNATLNLYRYDNETQSLELCSQLLKVDSGYVEFEVLLAGDYVVTDEEIEKKHPLDTVLIVALVIIALIIFALFWLLYSRNKTNIKKLHKRK
jgi:hypothetical protein